MRRILCSDWLPEWASDTARPGLPGTARFVPANKISPKFMRVHESFLSLKLLSAKVKGFFCDFSVVKEPEKASTRMKTKKTKMLISFKNTFGSKNRQIKHKSLFRI